MSANQRLSHPPVIEALLNFQANAVVGWAGEDTQEKAKKMFPDHTQVQTLQQFSVQMNDATPEPSVTHTPVLGYMLRSSTKPTVHQVRQDGYAYSQLSPYEHWDAFVNAAQAGWELYRNIFTPGELHHLALRFINRLEFPAAEFRRCREKFLTIAPRVPEGLDWAFYNFQQHYSYAVPDSPCLVNVQLVRLLEPGAAETSVMMLDTEVVLKEPLSALELSVQEVLAEMRRLKNAAFFGILTPEALARYI
jgi:uncharacterized protein (TIGR04255 family)